MSTSKDPKNILEQIFKELQLKNLSPKTQGEILEKMTELFLKRIVIKVLEILPENDRQEFSQIQESGNPEKMLNFLCYKIEGFNEMVEKELEEFKKETKQTVADLAAGLANAA